MSRALRREALAPPGPPEDVQALCREIVDQSADCIKILDASTRLLWMNEPGCRLMDICDLADVLGKRWLDFWAGDGQDAARAAVATARSGGVGRFTGPCATAGGTLKWWNVTVTRIAGPRKARLLSVSRDVTDIVALADAQRAIADAERAARAEADRASRAAEALLYNVSHDLRTPLTAILGWAAILGRTPSLETGPALAAIESAARQQMHLIEQLLSAARQQADVPFHAAPVELAHVIEHVVQSLQPVLAAKRLELQIARPEAPIRVAGDAAQLGRAVGNIAGNAVKFTPVGGTVRIALVAQDQTARLTVTDSGIGIDASALPRVFERFWRADQREAAPAGLGLGLSIARSIVEQHGGILEAHSDGAGCGASFTIQLPRLDERPHPDAVGGTGATRLAPDSGGTAAGDLSGLGIMLVVPDPAVRRALSVLLLQLGATVSETGRPGDSGLSFRAGAADVVVVDGELPPGDHQALLAACAGADGRSVPILTLVDPGGEAAGAVLSGRLEKPFAAGSLASRIRELARGTA